MDIRQAMVLAAGLGTRLRPITDTIPKPLVRIGGKPMIDYALDALVEAGVSKVSVNIHHLADQMEDHLSHEKRLDVLLSDERAQLLNSGGGLAKGLDLIGPEATFVLNADLFWVGEGKPSNLKRLAGFFDPARMDMAMLCVRLDQTTGHDGGSDFRMLADGQLVRDKTAGAAGVVYAGAFAMMPDFLADAPGGPFNLNIYFDRAIAAGRLFGLMLEGHWITVGTPDAIAPAEAVIAASRAGSAA